LLERLLGPLALGDGVGQFGRLDAMVSALRRDSLHFGAELLGVPLLPSGGERARRAPSLDVAQNIALAFDLDGLAEELHEDRGFDLRTVGMMGLL